MQIIVAAVDCTWELVGDGWVYMGAKCIPLPLPAGQCKCRKWQNCECQMAERMQMPPPTKKLIVICHLHKMQCDAPIGRSVSLLVSWSLSHSVTQSFNQLVRERNGLLIYWQSPLVSGQFPANVYIECVRTSHYKHTPRHDSHSTVFGVRVRGVIYQSVGRTTHTPHTRTISVCKSTAVDFAVNVRETQG